MALEDDALLWLWFQWEYGRRSVTRWEELKTLLLYYFRPVSLGSLHEQWLDHRQSGSVVEYRRKFVELMAPLDGIPEVVAKGQFIMGSKGKLTQR